MKDLYKKHEISQETFRENYKPVCNDCTPQAYKEIIEAFGQVLWERRDYSRIGDMLSEKRIWTIIDEGDIYRIIASIRIGLNNDIIGYIVTENPYLANNIALTNVVVKKKQ
jgi:hypothetical protein